VPRHPSHEIGLKRDNGLRETGKGTCKAIRDREASDRFKVFLPPGKGECYGTEKTIGVQKARLGDKVRRNPRLGKNERGTVFFNCGGGKKKHQRQGYERTKGGGTG